MVVCHLLTILKHARRWASDTTQQGGSNTLLYGAVGASAVGLGAWYLNRSGQKAESKAPASKEEAKSVPAKAEAPSKVFTGGDQGFIPLVLDQVDDINHNTKRFRFKFDSEDAVSGLTIASALITKYKGPEDEKPTIRPYTPTSDEGTVDTCERLDIQLTPMSM
jgi:cytochrome-b5 reductase